MTDEYLRGGHRDYLGPEPMAYRLHASAFLQCAELAIRAIRQGGHSEPNMMQNAPIVYLICHAIEMFLKLALYKTGSTDRDLKVFELRHDLMNLKQECETRGVIFSDNVTEMIEVLSPLHNRHKLRYTAFIDPPTWIPFTPSEMIDLTKKLVTASHPCQKA